MTTLDSAPRKAPTAPGGIPLLGHIVPLLRTPMVFLQALQPLGDIVRIQLGTLPVHVLNGPELVHEVLVTQGRKFRRGRFFEKVGEVVGLDLAHQGIDSQLQQRRMIQPAFQPNRMSGYGRIVSELASARAESWRPGELVELHDEMFQLVVSILAKVLFNTEAGERAGAALRRAMPIVLKQVAWQALSPSPLLNKLPTPGNRRLHMATTELRQAVSDLADEYCRTGHDYGDLLSMLLADHDHTGRRMSTAQLHSSVLVLMIAGTHTTALTLSALFDELGRQPDIERRVHDEVDHVLSGRPPLVEDLPKLPFTGRVVTETLRLHTPVRILMRRTIVPTSLGGVDLPANAEVLYSPYVMHRDPRWFPQPLRFDPDRWLPDRARPLPKGAFVPFSIGRNRCLGESFAWIETMLTAVTIASRWRLEPLPERTVRESGSAVPRPPVLPMILHPRQ